MNEPDIKFKSLDLPGEEDRPIIISGPCAAESERQVLSTALQLAKNGVRIFRGGVWKPRTKPGCFEGHGKPALAWLKRVKEETGMLVATEVATPEHAAEAMNAGIDLVWIGARTTANPFAVQALVDTMKGSDIPVLIKNPLNPDIELWIGAIERFYRAGIKRLAAIHRGFSFYGKSLYRNNPMWSIPIELHRRLPGLPIITDPSHIGGRRELIASLSQQAMDLGFDGLIIESHINPDEAMSDADQQITPDMLQAIISSLIIRNENTPNEGLNNLRKQIDSLDDQLMELLAKRMQVCREIGEYKKIHSLTARQAERYDEILNKRALQGRLSRMSPDFITKVFENIHEESIRQQVEILKNQ